MVARRVQIGSDPDYIDLVLYSVSGLEVYLLWQKTVSYYSLLLVRSCALCLTEVIRWMDVPIDGLLID